MAIYEVRNENGAKVDNQILSMFFGNVWKAALDRLQHRCDGWIHTLYHDGCTLKVYRKLDS